VADIFVSYTSKDRDWAFWIGQELEKLKHVPRIDAWEIPGGGNIMAWMLERLDTANHTLCVISPDYYNGPFASAEFQAALWAAQEARTNFLLPVRVADCELRRLLAPLKRCDLFGVDEDEARARLIDFLRPAEKPSTSTPFPGVRRPSAELKPSGQVPFPGKRVEPPSRIISNIPINVPRHFLGREADLAEIDAALKQGDGRAAITALHGLRGVGKTTLAAAYAEQHQKDYRATWWIRAEKSATLRADLVGLGVQFGWVAADAAEEPALALIGEKLRDEGEGVLLVYDNADDADQIRSYLPRGGLSHVIITSNAPNWSGVAADVGIKKWSNETGANYLLAQTGRRREHEAALALSTVLDGLPLAHEQAAAYCSRTGLPFVDYLKKYEAEPARFLDAVRDASPGYHNRRTVAKTFLLAIDEAAKLYPVAESLITYAALLAPEPIPLYLFSEGCENFADPFGAVIKGDGLDEAVAALRAFALVDRELILDERDPSKTTDCIRVHRLVREVVVTKVDADVKATIRSELIAAMASVYPRAILRDLTTWPRARRLDAIALALVTDDSSLPKEARADGSLILDLLAKYRRTILGAYSDALPLFERALAIDEEILGADDPQTAASLNNLGHLFQQIGKLSRARPYFERALAICEKALGPNHPDTASTLNNIGYTLMMEGELSEARVRYERALEIFEENRGADHPDTAMCLNNIGYLLQKMGNQLEARSYYERALAIREKALGPDHPDTATVLNNVAFTLWDEGDLAKARSCFERAVSISEKVFGPEHSNTIRLAENAVILFDEMRLVAEATALRQKFGLTNDDK
jgi:tetratricopeptide (TPR) repeat protein